MLYRVRTQRVFVRNTPFFDPSPDGAVYPSLVKGTVFDVGAKPFTNTTRSGGPSASPLPWLRITLAKATKGVLWDEGKGVLGPTTIPAGTYWIPMRAAANAPLTVEPISVARAPQPSPVPSPVPPPAPAPPAPLPPPIVLPAGLGSCWWCALLGFGLVGGSALFTHLSGRRSADAR